MSLIYHEVLKSIFKRPQQIPRFFLSTWSIYRSGSRAYASPLRLQLEQGTICNLSCQMCPLSRIKRPKGILTYDKFRTIFNKINPLFLNLTGLGESFLNPDILKMVSYAKKRRCFVKFDTNGILVNRSIADKILKSGLDVLSFSIDAADSKIYKKIRKADKFKNIIDNLKCLVKLRNLENSQLKIHVCTVVQKDNLNQLIKLIQMLDQIGIDRINTVYIVGHDIEKNNKSRSESYIQKLKQVINEYYTIKNTVKTEVDILPLEEYISKQENKNQVGACYIPWHSIYITWNGDVFPCCFYYDGQVKLGNIFKDDFKKMWNGPTQQSFRTKLVHNRNALPICARCELNEAYTSRTISILNKIPYLKLLNERS